MRVGYKLPLYASIVSIVLSVFLLSLILAADSTMLDDEHVTETLEDERVYTNLTEQLQDDLAENGSVIRAVEDRSLTPEQLSTAVITEPYARNELNGHVRNITSFLEGGDEDISFGLDYVVVKGNIARETDEGVSAQVNQSLPDVVRPDNRVSERTLERVAPITSRFQLLQYTAIVLSVLSVVLLLYLNRSVVETASITGFALVTAAVLQLIFSYSLRFIVNLFFLSFGGQRGLDPATLVDGATAVLISTLSTMIRQSFGILLVGGALAVTAQLVYFRRMRRVDSTSDVVGNGSIRPFLIPFWSGRRGTDPAATTGGEEPDRRLSNLDIDGEGSDATVPRGTRVEVAVGVTNESEQPSEFEPTLTVGETEMTSRTIELDGGSNERVTFDVATEDLAIGSHDLEISASGGDSTVSGTLDVEQ
jgi:uncharacterized membrane protein